MITLKEFLEAIDYKVTGGSEYQWKCFGPNARYLDSDNGTFENNTYTASAIFDSVDQTVYNVEVWDYVNNREYRWINPVYKQAMIDEAEHRGIDYKESSDEQKFIDLDVPKDMLEKISKIVAGEPYDTRVQIEVDFTDEELLQYMKLAHERDITFNQLVEEALRCAINDFEAGRLTKEDAQRFIRERDENNSSV